jgi:hypothetical protein
VNRGGRKAARFEVAAADTARLRAILDEHAPPGPPPRPGRTRGRRLAVVIFVLVAVVATVFAWVEGGGGPAWGERARTAVRWITDFVARLSAGGAG